MEELMGRRGDAELGTNAEFHTSYFCLRVRPLLSCLQSDEKLLISGKPKEKGSQAPKFTLLAALGSGDGG